MQKFKRQNVTRACRKVPKNSSNTHIGFLSGPVCVLHYFHLLLLLPLLLLLLRKVQTTR